MAPRLQRLHRRLPCSSSIFSQRSRQRCWRRKIQNGETLGSTLSLGQSPSASLALTWAQSRPGARACTRLPRALSGWRQAFGSTGEVGRFLRLRGRGLVVDGSSARAQRVDPRPCQRREDSSARAGRARSVLRSPTDGALIRTTENAIRCNRKAHKRTPIIANVTEPDYLAQAKRRIALVASVFSPVPAKPKWQET